VDDKDEAGLGRQVKDGDDEGDEDEAEEDDEIEADV